MQALSPSLTLTLHARRPRAGRRAPSLRLLDQLREREFVVIVDGVVDDVVVRLSGEALHDRDLVRDLVLGNALLLLVLEGQQNDRLYTEYPVYAALSLSES